MLLLLITLSTNTASSAKLFGTSWHGETDVANWFAAGDNAPEETSPFHPRDYDSMFDTDSETLWVGYSPVTVQNRVLVTFKSDVILSGIKITTGPTPADFAGSYQSMCVVLDGDTSGQICTAADLDIGSGELIVLAPTSPITLRKVELLVQIGEIAQIADLTIIYTDLPRDLCDACLSDEQCGPIAATGMACSTRGYCSCDEDWVDSDEDGTNGCETYIFGQVTADTCPELFVDTFNWQTDVITDSAGTFGFTLLDSSSNILHQRIAALAAEGESENIQVTSKIDSIVIETDTENGFYGVIYVIFNGQRQCFQCINCDATSPTLELDQIYLDGTSFVTDGTLPHAICITSCTFQRVEGAFSVIGDNLYQSVPTLYKEWTLSVEIMPTGTVSGYSNVLQVGLGGDDTDYGDHSPAIFFDSLDTTLHIKSAVSGDKGYFTNSCDAIPLNDWTLVVVTQTLQGDGTYQYAVELDGEVVDQLTNTDPREFDDVKVYTSNSMDPAAAAKIGNFELQTNPGGLTLGTGTTFDCETNSHSCDENAICEADFMCFGLNCLFECNCVGCTCKSGFSGDGSVGNCVSDDTFADLVAAALLNVLNCYVRDTAGRLHVIFTTVALKEANEHKVIACFNGYIEYITVDGFDEWVLVYIEDIKVQVCKTSPKWGGLAFSTCMFLTKTAQSVLEGTLELEEIRQDLEDYFAQLTIIG